MGTLPHNGVPYYLAYLAPNPAFPTPPLNHWYNQHSASSPSIRRHASWAYKILPFIEQGNLFNNWNYNVRSSVYGSDLGLALGYPAFRGMWRDLALGSWHRPDTIIRLPTILYNAGAVTDYAANVMVIPSLNNTTPNRGQYRLGRPIWYRAERRNPVCAPLHDWEYPGRFLQYGLAWGKCLTTETINRSRPGVYNIYHAERNAP